jgi:hypothetical protein
VKRSSVPSALAAVLVVPGAASAANHENIRVTESAEDWLRWNRVAAA